MTTVVLTPVEAGDGLARQGVAAVGEAAATTISLGATGEAPSANGFGYLGDDQAQNAPSATRAEDQPAMTTSSGPIGNHAQCTIEAAVEGCKAAFTTAELAPGYPMPILHQEGALQAALLAGQQDQQARPTSSAQPLVSAASPADSMATEGQADGQGGSESNGVAMEVDMQQVSARSHHKKELPAFIQTSSLIPNSCGYCGTRQTSGCWRRGWDIGNGKFINLCNKCGLRHKAGKLHSVPGPTPPQSRRSTAHPSPSRGSSYSHNTANSNAAAFNPAAFRDAALAAAGAATAASKVPVAPASSANALLKVMGQQLLVDQQQTTAAGSLAPTTAGGAMLASSSSPNLLHAALKAEQQAAAAGEDGARAQGAFLASVAAAAAAAAAAGPEDASKPDALSLIGPSGLAASSAAATAAQQGLPDFAAVAASKGLVSSLIGMDPNTLLDTTSSGGSASVQAVAALAAASAAADGLDVGGVAGQLSGLSPEMVAYLGSIMAGDAPAPKRRRTKKPAVPGPSATAGRGGRAPAAGGAQQLQREDSLAAGAAADALLALNRSSASTSPVGSPPGPPPAAAAAVNFMEAAAAAAAGHAAAVADRETAAAVDAAAAAAGGWSPALEAFLAQPAGVKRGRAATGGGGGGGAAAAAAGARVSSGRPAEQSGRQGLSRQVSSPGPGTPARVASGRQPSALLTPSPRAWSTEQLHAWMQGSNCADAMNAFKEHNVDGSALAGLLRVSGGGEAARLYELLGSELGVQQVGLRLRLVESLMMSFGGH